MPKRQHKPDPRWNRTEAGLIVPRKPTLPTRRYIQHLGTAQCCCGQDGNCLFTGDTPSSVSVEVSGLTDDACPCTDWNDSFELSLYDFHNSWDAYCTAIYRLVVDEGTSSVIQVTMTINHPDEYRVIHGSWTDFGKCPGYPTLANGADYYYGGVYLPGVGYVEETNDRFSPGTYTLTFRNAVGSGRCIDFGQMVVSWS
jgi:hypothetical protein